MVTWIRKSFSAVGLTQVPSGPHLAQLRLHLGGVVMLMIDVSGSMHGRPLMAAKQGAMEFVREAIEARYLVGVMLWNTSVIALAEPRFGGENAVETLRQMDSAYGGNALDVPLAQCHQILDGFGGDRVVALFGDGDLSPKNEVLERISAMKSENIRFITRGLGERASSEFAEISDEAPESVGIDSVEELAAGIASMAAGLKRS